MDIIFSASIIASFLAGMVALFAPCCITVLLPAYLGSAFREKKNIIKMTFVFFLGIAVIIIPIGLGAAGLAQIFRNFHKEMYIFGGAFMIILAIMAISGRGLAMIPMKKRKAPKVDSFNAKSVFGLGIFSGAATSCCAPVLAGAITLAAISGAFWKALVVVFAYVFGMTFPLFITAYFYDRFKIENSRFIKGKVWQFKIGRKEIFLHSTNLLAGIMFFTVGIILLVLAFSNKAFWAPSYQVKIGNALNQWSEKALSFLDIAPDIVWGLIILALFLFLVRKSIWSRKKE